MKTQFHNLLCGAVVAANVAGLSIAQTRADDVTVVLVHGAFSDGSSWNKVIPLLQARGLHVVAVQNHSHRWLTMLRA